MRNFCSPWLVKLAILAACALSSAHADLVEAIPRVKSSVVIVGTYAATNSPRFALRGTGFVIGNGNWVVTNAHVLPDAADANLDAKLVVQVRAESRGLTGQGDLNMRQAKVLDIDKLHDLALLQFDGAPAPQLTLRDSDLVHEGQAVAFMGFPIGDVLGFSAVTHRGSVSSITPIALPTASAQQLNARTVASLRSGTFNIFQLDATAYPGNSGGPLFDPETGDLLGVINMVFVKGTKESVLSAPSGISYAIPGNFVQQMLQRRKPN
jgi:S1-C subfamily serine protease